MAEQLQTVHIPLDPMQLEVHPVSSSHVSWVYKWSNVDLSSKVESFSPDFGHANGWVWRLLLQHHTNPDGNRVYSLFLYVVLTDTELREPTWTRKIRVMQFQILNSEGRRLKDKSTIALFNENQLTWGFPGLIDNAHLMRDPVVAAEKKVDVILRLRYLPEYERVRRPLSPPISGVYRPAIENTTTPDHADHNAAAKVFDPRAVVVDPVGLSLRPLVNNPTFSDIQILVGRDRVLFHGHKAILAARSIWFESALNPLYRESQEGVIRLPEEDPKIWAMLFEFLYTGDYPLSTALVLGKMGPPVSGAKSSSSPQLPKVSTIRTMPRSSVAPSPTTTPSPTPNAMRKGTTTTTGGTVGPASGLGGYDFDEERAVEEFDDARFQLYLLADKYGVAQLKCLIRVHVTNELLDPSSGIQTSLQGQRLLKLIRFAFEDLPEAVTQQQSSEHGAGLLKQIPGVLGHRTRDSGIGDDLASDAEVGTVGSAFDRVFAQRSQQQQQQRGGSPPAGANTISPAGAPPALTGQANTGQRQPDGSNAARILSSVFAPPPEQQQQQQQQQPQQRAEASSPYPPPPPQQGPQQGPVRPSSNPGHRQSVLSQPYHPGLGLFSNPRDNNSSQQSSGSPSTSPPPPQQQQQQQPFSFSASSPTPPSTTHGTPTTTTTALPPITTPSPAPASSPLPRLDQLNLHQQQQAHAGASLSSTRSPLDPRRHPSGARGGWQSTASTTSTTSTATTTAALGALSLAPGGRQPSGRYGRDVETQLLREAIVGYVAKMFPSVRRVDGFEELMREGGEVGGFATEVMERMYVGR